MTIDESSLAEFRFQIFQEDVLDPLIKLDSKERGDTGYENFYAFACGELREAVTMASLGAAYGVYPRDQFSTMLDNSYVRARIDGEFHGPEGRPRHWPPTPVDGLPDGNDALLWTQHEVPDNQTNTVGGLLDTYSSVMRQVRRNEFERRFNAELLFAEDEVWQEEVRMLQSAVIPWVTGAIDEPQCMWLPEGLDSFLDFAVDVGVQIDKTVSGEFEGFDWPYYRWADLKESDAYGIIIGRSSLFRVTEWRFGGPSRHEQVTERVRQLQGLISEIVTAVKYRLEWPGRASQP